MSLVVETQSTVGISPGGSYANTTRGVVLHYPGASSLSLGSHETCRQQVRNWDAQHRRQGWSGLGYNGALCHHGILMLGRGLNRQGAHAPGANSTHFGLLIMVANNSDMTPDQLRGFREVLEWLRSKGVNSSNVTPHSRWISTSCPGNIIRSRITQNNWSGGVEVTPGTGSGSGSGGGMTSVRSVKSQQELVNAAGYSPKLVVDGIWGPKTDAGVKWYQRKLGVTADGLWGPSTEAAHTKSPKGEEKPVIKNKVTVDGILGRETISALQRALNEGRF